MIIIKHPTCKISYKIQCKTCKNFFLFFGAKKTADKRKFCSRNCMKVFTRGENSPRWKGGFHRKDGYREIMINGKRILYHRYLMEQSLNKKLTRFEYVHHKDGNPFNNKIENLEILNPHQHPIKHSKVFRSKTHKQCTRCMVVKTRNNFCKNRKNQIGLLDPHDTICKKCRVNLMRIRRSK